VNGSNWLFHEVEFLDLDGERLKTVTIHSAEDFDGIWCATDIEVINHQTAHETRFRVPGCRVRPGPAAGLFEANTLNRGCRHSLPAMTALAEPVAGKPHRLPWALPSLLASLPVRARVHGDARDLSLGVRQQRRS
jgi:hypothetical protein